MVELEGLEPVVPDGQIVMIMPQSLYAGPGNVEINPQQLGWLARKAFYKQAYDRDYSLGGPPRHLLQYRLLQFKPSISTDALTGGSASVQGGSEDIEEYPGDHQKTRIETPLRKDGQRNRRFKLRNTSIQTSVPTAGSKAMGWLGLIIATGELIYNATETYHILSADDEINRQADEAVNAIYDVHFAMQAGLIPQEYMNPADIAVISNVLVTGTLTKSTQKYIFRNGDYQHLRKADFSKTISFAQNLSSELKKYEVTVYGSIFRATAGLQEIASDVIETINKPQ